MPKPKNLLFHIVSPFIKPAAVEVEVKLRDGDRMGQLTVIHTLGHTLGSIALLERKGKRFSSVTPSVSMEKKSARHRNVSV
jgi:glyoxylase-like metal-dependent hydrolase (beta-lactamase superfamily II)